MNKEWSELNKVMQLQIKKRDTFSSGVEALLELRNEIMGTLLDFKKKMSRVEFNAIPFMNVDGFHNKTIAYSLWHIFRIEDIVAHSLIAEDEQVFFKGNYQKRINSPIITTGNELVKEQIVDFSRELNLEELYAYILEVKNSTDMLLKELTYDELKKKVPASKKQYLDSIHVVSDDAKASFLIDYWCGKDVKGLLQMPFSRHWIMHAEACIRIKNKIHPKDR